MIVRSIIDVIENRMPLPLPIILKILYNSKSNIPMQQETFKDF